MADWVSIENALVAWVREASGYPEGQVIWAEQTPTGSRPQGAIITLRLGDIVDVTGLDELDATTDLNRPAGQEIKLQAKGFKRFTLTLQAFGNDSSEATTGASAGRSVLGVCQSSLSLPSVRSSLGEVDISVLDTGTVQNVTAVDHGKFESRAVCEFEFYCLETVEELTGYIEEVDATSYLGDPLGTTDAIDI